MSVFGAIEELFQVNLHRGLLDAAVQRWHTRHPCLVLASDGQDVVRVGRSGDTQVKESILGALCLEASRGDGEAQVTIVWLLLPALLREARSLAARTALEPDELHAEMLLGLFSEVLNVRAGDRNVAGRLLNRARWRARDASRQALDRELHEISVAEPAEDGSVACAGWESQVEWSAVGWGRLEGTDIVRRAVMQGLITGQEAEILMSDRRSSTELCVRWGISASALQCRRKRIRQRLAEWFRQTFPDAVRP